MPPEGLPAAPPAGAPFSAAGGPPGAIPPSGVCACAALRPRASTTLAPPSKIVLTFMTVLHTRIVASNTHRCSLLNIAPLSLFRRETKMPSLVGAEKSDRVLSPDRLDALELQFAARLASLPFRAATVCWE
jgi:hypothetical protein